MRDMEATEQTSLPGMHVLYPEVNLIINVMFLSLKLMISMISKSK